MRSSPITYFAVHYTPLFPLTLLAVFLLSVARMNLPNKGAFWGRAMVALVVATFLAHVNRIFHLWPAHLLFPSGHTTFCLGLSISLAMLRPWTLFVTLPLVAVLAFSMVYMKYHTVLDILGAIPLALVTYAIIHRIWRLPMDSPLLDRWTLST